MFLLVGVIYPRMGLVHLYGSLYCYRAWVHNILSMHRAGRTHMHHLLIVQRYARRWAFVRACRRGLLAHRLPRLKIRVKNRGGPTKQGGEGACSQRARRG